MTSRPLALLSSLLLTAACGPGPLTVEARSEYGGTPMPGIKVALGEGEWVTTDAQGRAFFQAAERPGVVRVHQTNVGSSGKVFHDYWELGVPKEELLVLYVDSFLPVRGSALSGAVSGAAGWAVSVFAPYMAGTLKKAASAGDFQFSSAQVAWEDTESLEATVFALAHDSAEPPTSYTGYAQANVQLTHGGSASVSLSLEPVFTEHVTGTVTASSTATVSGSLELEVGESSLWLGPTGAASTAFDFAFPRVTGAEAWLSYFAVEADGSTAEHARQVTLPATGLAFDLPAAVTLASPANEASSAAVGTVFSWSAAPEDALYNLHVGCVFPSGANVNYRALETTGTSLTVPALEGVSIPSGSSCDWDVSWRPAGSIETDLRRARSVRRTFTTP